MSTCVFSSFCKLALSAVLDGVFKSIVSFPVIAHLLFLGLQKPMNQFCDGNAHEEFQCWDDIGIEGSPRLNDETVVADRMEAIVFR